MSVAGSSINNPQPLTTLPSVTTYNGWAPTNAFSLPDLVRATTSPTNAANSAVNTTLTMSLKASTNYVFDAYLFFSNAGGSSANFQVHALASATLIFAGGMMDTTALTAVEDGIATATGTNVFGTSCTTAGNNFAHVHGLLTGGVAADTLQLDFINPAAAGTLTFTAGSFMEVKQIA